MHHQISLYRIVFIEIKLFFLYLPTPVEQGATTKADRGATTSSGCFSQQSPSFLVSAETPMFSGLCGYIFTGCFSLLHASVTWKYQCGRSRRSATRQRKWVWSYAAGADPGVKTRPVAKLRLRVTLSPVFKIKARRRRGENPAGLLFYQTTPGGKSGNVSRDF